MKNFLPTVVFLIIGYLTTAQVGIGTTNPNASLDISATNVATPNNNDGLLIPRIDDFPLTIPTAAQDGMMVFITGNGAQAKGFYYWDQNTTSWVGFTGIEKIDDLIDGKSDNDGSQNGSSVFLGLGAGTNDDSSDNGNTAVGYNSLNAVTTGMQNVAIGHESLILNTTGNRNTAVGGLALSSQIAAGDDNTALGWSALFNNVSGSDNVALGAEALLNNDSGNFNLAVGNSSLLNLTQGSGNVSIGYFAQRDNITGEFNVALGNNSLRTNADGDSNIAIGRLAGWRNEGSGNIFLGNEAGALELTASNKLYIDNNSTSNPLVYGEFNTNIFRINGALQVGNPAGSGYILPTADGTAGQVLITNGANNVSWADASDESTTASNGLTEVTDDIRLGGALTQNTTISQGIRSFDINLNSTGDFALQDNGTDVFFVEDSGDIGVGTSNPAHPFHIVESTTTELQGLYIDKTDNTSSETNGLYVEKAASGTGRSHAIRTRNDGSGTGNKYGVFNTISSAASGGQYGTRNFLAGASPSFQFGTFNNLDNSGTSNHYGVYNGMRGASAGNLYGVYNEFERAYTSADEIVGVRNRFTGGTPGTDGMNGIWTDFTTATNGNYYGVRTEFSSAATGTGNKYGSYNLINATAGGTHYGTYNNISTSNGWAGYFIGRNYISDRLSIGETNNAAAKISILNNSGGSNPAHIELRESASGDGARIRFNNDVETTNEWILFGRADNTIADSQFNVFHTTTGNVITASGDGDVGITGNADTDFHVFHGNNGSADGMKLQNTTDNTWWRLYVSSGSDDLRLFNSNNGTTIMGAFNDATGAYTATSDRRLKKDFKDLYFSWEKFQQLEPLTYKYITDDSHRRYVGMVAQDVEKIYPEIVNYQTDQDTYQMDYSATGVIAIKGVQELKKEMDLLKDENKQLKIKLAKLEILEARLTALENSSKLNNPTIVIAKE